MTPLVSIIIPTYNRAHLIGETLDSVIAQTYTHWECIIVDDGSTDNSFEVIQKYLISDSRFVHFSRPAYKKKGPSSCRNFGIEKATGAYIIFLDSDDLLADFCLKNRVKFAIANRDYDFWIFKMSAFEKRIDNICFTYENINVDKESMFCKNEFMRGVHPFVVTGPMWKKKTLFDLNGFNENFTMIEDPELHLRALKLGYILKFSNFLNCDCFYRQQSLERKKVTLKEVQNNYLFFKIHLDKKEENIVLYFKKMFNVLIFEEMFFSFFYSFSSLALRKGIFGFDNIFNGFIVLFYQAFNINKLKGYGYQYFKTKFNNF